MNLKNLINKIKENKEKLLSEDYWIKLFEQNNLTYNSNFPTYIVYLEDKEIVVNYEIVKSYYFWDYIKIKDYKIHDLAKDKMKSQKL